MTPMSLFLSSALLRTMSMRTSQEYFLHIQYNALIYIFNLSCIFPLFLFFFSHSLQMAFKLGRVVALAFSILILLVCPFLPAEILGRGGRLIKLKEVSSILLRLSKNSLQLFY